MWYECAAAMQHRKFRDGISLRQLPEAYLSPILTQATSVRLHACLSDGHRQPMTHFWVKEESRQPVLGL